MAQPSKKPTTTRTTATMADKAAKTAFTVAKTTRDSAENVVKFGSNALNEIYSASTTNAERAKEKMFEMSRESAAQMARAGDTMTQGMQETVSMARDNMETMVECCSRSANLAKEISSEMTEYCTQAFSDMMEVSKDAFACRTINDMMELQSRIMRNTMDGFFSQSMKMTNMCFEFATDSMEPINERVTQATQQISKMMSA